MAESIIIALPVLLAGGTEVHVLGLVRVLAGEGHKVRVCCYYESDAGMAGRMEAAGAEVVLMDGSRAGGLMRLARDLIRLFKAARPDIVHVMYLAPGLVPVIAARLAGVKTVFATVHQPADPYGWRERLFLRSAARLCSSFFCVSSAVERSWFGNSCVLRPGSPDTFRKHHTIYNAVDAVRIGEAAASVDREGLKRTLGLGGMKVIGVAGRLREEKGQKVLLEALPDILRVLPRTMLMVIGDGPDREALMRRAERSGISGNIVWLGQKTPEEIYSLYGVMDVLAVPSIFEGFGLVAAEAMAASVPVVASRVGGLVEVVSRGKTGLLVSPERPDALAEALTALLMDPDKTRSMGEAGRASVIDRFSPDRFRESILAAYGAHA